MDPWQAIVNADEEGNARLEFVNKIPVWEAFPSFGHQKHVDRIRNSIRPLAQNGSPCGCVHAADVVVRFPNGSLKRPDVAVFCREPDEMHKAITLLPEAVIEVVSPDYEAKDLVIGVPFYISHYIRDVVVFDPATDEVTHYRDGKPALHTSPVELEFACGCACVV